MSAILVQQQGSRRGRKPALLPAASVWNPEYPDQYQALPFDCAAESFAWLCGSLGHPMDEWAALEILGDAINEHDGLRFGDGSELFEPLSAITGYPARNAWASYDDLLAVAGIQPAIFGGQGWYHWSGLRGRTGDDLRIMNPAPGWKGIGSTITRAQAQALGPFAMVVVDLAAHQTPHNAARIALALAASPAGVETTLPALEAALAEWRCADRAVLIGALATARVEVGWGMLPIREYASGWDYDPSVAPAKALELGNLYVGDGPAFRGGGLIQLTGRDNYRAAGKALGVDLEGHPELSIDPATSARVMAWYFTTHLYPDSRTGRYEPVVHFARQGRWEAVRRAVNGGTNGLGDFLEYVESLEAVL